MSINWVMIAEQGGYTPLPGEQTLYQSPQRTTLSLKSDRRLPPTQAYAQQCKDGTVFLTNRRIIYLPQHPTPNFESFTVPILNVSDSRVAAPWFGPNKWEALVTPVYGGGIPAHHSELELVMEFKEGGAFDFSTIFERLKERLKQAVDIARENGLATGDGAELGDARGGGALSGVNLNSVHLEDLPAYEESRGSSIGTANQSSSVASPLQDNFQPPNEPPPGYEEVQMGGVADELERRLREQREDNADSR